MNRLSVKRISHHQHSGSHLFPPHNRRWIFGNWAIWVSTSRALGGGGAGFWAGSNQPACLMITFSHVANAATGQEAARLRRLRPVGKPECTINTVLHGWCSTCGTGTSSGRCATLLERDGLSSLSNRAAGASGKHSGHDRCGLAAGVHRPGNYRISLRLAKEGTPNKKKHRMEKHSVFVFLARSLI